MNRRLITSGFFYAIIFLALIGFVTQLLNNPNQLLKSIFTFLLIGLIIFGIARFILQKSTRRAHSTKSNDMKKYEQAAKQSHLQQKQKKQQNKRVTQRPSHLKVIDGKKKKKERTDSLH